MFNKKIEFIIFLSLLAQVANAQEFIKIRVNLNDVAPNTFSSIDKTFEWLNLQGITVDENSSVTFHQEENYIDLTCFNCVVRSVGNEVDMVHSYNELGGGGTK